MDSFRLVRYEMSTGKPSCRVQNILLQQRHNAAPGMVLVSKPTAGLAERLQTLLGACLHCSHWVAAAVLAVKEKRR